MIPDKSCPDNLQKSNQKLFEENRLLHQELAEIKAEIRVKNERDHTLFGAIKLGFWEWDIVEDKPIYFSGQFANIHGFSLAELYDLYQCEEDLFGLIYPEDLEDYQRHITHVSRSENLNDQAYVFDYRIVRPSGEVRHVRELEYGFMDKNGNPTRTYGAVQDITDHKEALEAQKRGEERYSSLFSQLPLGVEEQDYSSIKKRVDKIRSEGHDNIREYLENNGELLRELVASTRITGANEALLKFHGTDSLEKFCEDEADIGSWWNDDWVRFFASEIEGLLKPGHIHLTELAETRVDGTYFETRMITKVVRGCEDTWERVITLHDDVTERKRNEIALIEAKTEAEMANQAKSQFLSSMSHELCTPLNAILGFSQLLEYDEKLEQKQRGNARLINQAGSHLLSLVDEVLDLSRIEVGEIELSIEAVSLAKILVDSVNWVGKMARSKKINIEFDQAQFKGLLIQADAIRLKQVFLNILSNAVKYNHDNGSVSICYQQQQDDRVRIEFSDTGPGLSKKQVSNLFQPFNRLGAECSAIEGTGIGLVITQRLINLMQGQLSVDSVPGKGSTFCVELPTARLPATECLDKFDHLARQRESTNNIEPYSMQILVAEDNPVNQILIEAQIKQLGYKADFAENGAVALKLWQSGKYHLLLTDIRMPIMDGYELIQRIRSPEANNGQNKPIIVITANAMEGDAKMCFEAGASDLMTKPFKLEDLKQMLEKWSHREAAIDGQ